MTKPMIVLSLWSDDLLHVTTSAEPDACLADLAARVPMRLLETWTVTATPAVHRRAIARAMRRVDEVLGLSHIRNGWYHASDYGVANVITALRAGAITRTSELVATMDELDRLRGLDDCVVRIARLIGGPDRRNIRDLDASVLVGLVVDGAPMARLRAKQILADYRRDPTAFRRAA